MNSVIATLNDEADVAHVCDAIILPCMDFCFHKPVQQAIEHTLKITLCDLRPEPGVSLALITPGPRHDALMADIKCAMDTHHVSKVILVDHSGCAAYKMAGLTFEDMGIEEGRHEENLKLAKKYIHEKFPNIEVVTIYAKKHSGKIELIQMH